MSKEVKNLVPKGAKYEIEVEGKVCYLKALDKATLEIVLGMTAGSENSQLIRAGEVILNRCWVGGDEEIRKNDELTVAAAFQCYELIEIKEATLKKL